MKRALVAFALLSGCASSDPCAGHDGACLGVRVTGSGRVDQLRLVLSGAAHLDGRTPATPGPERALPVTTAIFLPAVAGAAQLGVIGFLDGSIVGQGMISVELAPRRQRTVEVAIGPVGGDLAGSLDAASPDLAAVDLAVPDLAMEDAAQPIADAAPDAAIDLRTIDLIPPPDFALPARHVFLLPPRTGDLGTLAYLDQECGLAAQAGGLPDAGYRAIVAYPTVEPKNHAGVTQGRRIALPSGATVADDGTFFSTTVQHQHAINELAGGQAAPPSCCVWTNFGPQGFRINAPDCSGWTVGSDAGSGIIGDCQLKDDSWAVSGGTDCDESCHVYCIEQ